MRSLYFRELRSDEFAVMCDVEECGEEAEWKMTVNDTLVTYLCKSHLRNVIPSIIEDE